MRFADAHCDTLGKRHGKKTDSLDVTNQALIDGNVGLQIFASFCNWKRLSDSVYEHYMSQVDDFLALVDEYSCLRYEKDLPGALPTDYTLAVPSVEGAEAFEGSMEKMQNFIDKGVRLVTLTWNYENELAFPNGENGGLKPFGVKAVKHLCQNHVGIDVSHLSEKGFWDLYDAAPTFMASHSNAQQLCGHKRNLTNQQIKAIIERKGFIGLNFFSDFLVEDESRCTVDDVVRHADHILQLGGENVLGFGSDFDGITGRPEGVRGAEHFPMIMAAFDRLNLNDEQKAKIAGQNLLNYLVSL